MKRPPLLESISHPERLVIADELGHLGDAITQLNYAAIVFPSFICLVQVYA
jgi:hypothetical protein